MVGAAGSFLGARVTSLYVQGQRLKLKQIFGLLIVVMTAYKLLQIPSKQGRSNELLDRVSIFL